MTRFFAIVFLVFLLLLGAGFLVIGAFPPHIHRVPVEHDIPAAKFK